MEKDKREGAGKPRGEKNGVVVYEKMIYLVEILKRERERERFYPRDRRKAKFSKKKKVLPALRTCYRQKYIRAVYTVARITIRSKHLDATLRQPEAFFSHLVRDASTSTTRTPRAESDLSIQGLYE